MVPDVFYDAAAPANVKSYFSSALVSVLNSAGLCHSILFNRRADTCVPCCSVLDKENHISGQSNLSY